MLRDRAGKDDVVAGERAQARLVGPRADDLERRVEPVRRARERLDGETAALLRDEPRDEADAPGGRSRPAAAGRERRRAAARGAARRNPCAAAPGRPRSSTGTPRRRGGAPCAPSAGRTAGSACRGSAPCRSLIVAFGTSRAAARTMPRAARLYGSSCTSTMSGWSSRMSARSARCEYQNRIGCLLPWIGSTCTGTSGSCDAVTTLPPSLHAGGHATCTSQPCCVRSRRSRSRNSGTTALWNSRRTRIRESPS